MGSDEYNQGKKAEALKDYDSALIHYDRALKADPQNVIYEENVDRLRFQSAQTHVETGQKILAKGDLQMALAEFQKAAMIDPASPIAQQETQATLARHRGEKRSGEGSPPLLPKKSPR